MSVAATGATVMAVARALGRVGHTAAALLPLLESTREAAPTAPWLAVPLARAAAASVAPSEVRMHGVRVRLAMLVLSLALALALTVREARFRRVHVPLRALH